MDEKAMHRSGNAHCRRHGTPVAWVRALLSGLLIASLAACGGDGGPPADDSGADDDTGSLSDVTDNGADVSDGSVDSTGDASDGSTDTADVQTETDATDNSDVADTTDEPDPGPPEWSAPIANWPAALLSVSGTGDDDVWVVGAAVDGRATALHWDGAMWTVHDTGFGGDLWWVQALADGSVWMAGESGAVLRYVDGAFERVSTPMLGRHTLFGLRASSADEVWVVGGISARGGLVWRYREGEGWAQVPLPLDAPVMAHGDTHAVFKAWEDADGRMVLVGGGGAIYREGEDGELALWRTLGHGTLFTVAGDGDELVAVGSAALLGAGFMGFAVSIGDGNDVRTWDFPQTTLLQGVAFGPDGRPWVSGADGILLRREHDGDWQQFAHGLPVVVQSLHAVWVSPSGQVWSVGGNVLSPALDHGVLVHGAVGDVQAPAELEPPELEVESTVCTPEVIAAGTDGTVVRRWNEQTLHAIRRAFPEPTVHARNLYHLHVTLHDAWAAYTTLHPGLIVDEAAQTGGVTARNTTMSHAAYRLLLHRYSGRIRGELAVNCFRAVMEDLGLDPDEDDVEGDSPAALGNRIGQAVIDYFASDGARERTDYDDPTYNFANPPLLVDDPGLRVDDPSTWQPLDIARAVTQNGIPEPAGPQLYIGPHWGGVTPFAIRRPDFDVPYFPLGERPTVESEQIAEWVLEVIRKTAWLDIDDGATMDISPGAFGNNPLGSDDGEGHPLNPATGEPYAPQVVPRGDFARVLAEFWADGPDSETPPGHWNTLAHGVFDHPDFERRFYGEGPEVDRLTWEIWFFLVLNGALHDAAILAWESKRLYETSRPMTLIRWMGHNGQRTDPDGPSYHADGLPLVDGLVELITEASTAPGERHAHLARHVGEVAVFSWPGEPADVHSQRSPHVWMRAVEWMPYQPRSFVNPAFPGYVSGHSTFSRAAAVVLDRLTGSPYFPGGLGEFVAEQNGYLEFEQGPSVEVRLQWATWYDAADQAGQSRLWGGIHIVPDDFDGRHLGQRAGDAAAEWAINRIAGLNPLPSIGDPSNPIHGGLPDDLLPDDPGGPPSGDPDYVIGTGRTTWEPLRQGNILRWERGLQGGHHIWLGVRADNALLAPLSSSERQALRTRVEVHNAAGDLVAAATRFGGYAPLGDDYHALAGVFAVLVGTIHPNDLAGIPLTVTATLELPEDESRLSAVQIFTACCD